MSDRKGHARIGMDADLLMQLAKSVQQVPEPQRDAALVWQTWLADLLQEDPSVAQVLRELIDDLQQRQPAMQRQWVPVGWDAFVAGREPRVVTGSSRQS